MNSAEPSFLTHQNEVRQGALLEGGLSTVIFCGKVRAGSDLADILHVHRKIVEDEVNDEEVNVTGILMGQVWLTYSAVQLPHK